MSLSSRVRLRAGFAVASVFAATAALVTPALAGPEPSNRPGRPQARPVVVAHRGASGYRPEHTLAAYRLAIAMGADVIEPDLVSTRDGVLVARHENEISGTTDVADRPEFADRRTTKVVDGTRLTGWFTEDFTLAELRTLRAKERIPELRPRNTLYDGRYQVPTFQEVLDLAEAESRRTGRRIGVAPETKHSSYFRSIGLPLEEPLVAALRRSGLDHPNAPVLIQSFEVGNLKRLSRMTKAPLAQLLDASGAPYDLRVAGDPRTYDDLATPAGLREIAEYAAVVGPHKNRVVPRDAEGRLLEPTRFVADAHEAGLEVHPWTFRNENAFLPADLREGDDPAAYGDAFAEYRLFYELGVDGVFADHPDTAVEAREAFLAARRAG